MASALFSIILCLTLALASGDPSSPSTQLLAVDRQISPEVFDCNGKDPTLNTLCKIVLGKVNKELSAAGIAINKDAILFKYDNQDHQKIDTGHSCSTRAELRRRTLTAKISRKSAISVTFPSLHSPIAVALKLPVSLHANAVVRQRYGSKWFGKCHRIGRDTFTLSGRLSTTANTAVAFSLNPKVRVLPSGDISIKIRPEVAALFNLRNTDVKLRIRGASPLSAVWTFLNARFGSIFKAVDLAISGKSFPVIWDRVIKGAAFSFGSTLVIAGGNPLFDLLRKIDQKGGYAQRFAEKKANKIIDDLEIELNKKIKSALKVGPDGTREFIIGSNFRQLISSSGMKANVVKLPQPKKSLAKSPKASCAQSCSNSFDHSGGCGSKPPSQISSCYSRRYACINRC